MASQNPKLKKLLWWSLILAVGLIIILGWAVFIGPRLIPWDKIKLQTEKKLTDTLHHSVTVGSMGFNLFRGVEIHQLRIANAPGFSATPLLSTESAVVQYRLLPLLWGQLIIKAVLVDRPALLIERTSDGRFNFSDMLPAKTGAAARPESGRTQAGPTQLPVHLLVSRLAILQGSLAFRDIKSQNVYAVDQIDFEVRNLNLAGLTPVKMMLGAKVHVPGLTIPVKASADWRLDYLQERFVLDRMDAELPGLQFTTSGQVDKLLTAPDLNLNGSLHMEVVALLAGFRPLVQPKLLSRFRVSGSGRVEFSIAGPAKDPAALAIRVTEALDLKATLMNLNLPVTLKGTWSLAQGTLGLQQRLLLPGLQADLAGNVQDLMAGRLVDANLTAKLDLAAAGAKLMPPTAAEKPAAVKTTGTITIAAKLAGPVADPQKLVVSASMEAKDVGADYQGKSILSGLRTRVEVRHDQIKLQDLSCRLGGQQVNASFLAEAFDLRHPETLKPEVLKARVTWKLASPLLDLDALLALMPAPAKKTSNRIEAEPETVSDLPEPDAKDMLPAGLSMQGSAALGGLKFGKVKLGKMDFGLELKQRKLDENGTLQGYLGTIQEKVRLDFSQKLLGYTVTAQAKAVDVEPLLNDVVDTFVAAKLKKPEIISELKSKLTGRLSGSLALQGAGLRTMNAKPRLTGQGDFSLADGKIRQFAFQENLAAWFGSEKLKQDIPFDQTSIEFKIAQQRVNVTKFSAQSVRGGGGDLRLWGQGQITFASDFKDFKLHPSLNPRASAALAPEFKRYAEVMKDERGWMTVPAILNGPVKKPNVQPDWEWIKKQFGAYADKKIKSTAAEAGNKVKSFLQKEQNKSPEQMKQDVNREIEHVKEQIKNLDGLKNLFK